MSTVTTSKSVPAYVSFCAAIIAECQAQGLDPLRDATESGLPQNEGYCFLRFQEGGAALIVPKSKNRMAPCHSHVDLSGVEGFIPLPRKNGRVICHFESDLGLLATVLPFFVGASKRASLPPVRKTQSAPVEATPSLETETYEHEEVEEEMEQSIVQLVSVA